MRGQHECMASISLTLSLDQRAKFVKIGKNWRS
jgi:hypothetical protein